MRRFFVADLGLRGDLKATAEYRYEQLEQIPGAAELIVQFATNLYRSPEEFELALARGKEHLRYRWCASAETAGITTLRNDGQLASLAILASGVKPEADRLTLDAFQTHLLRELHGTEYEPAFGLREVADRPLVAVVAFAAPPDPVDQVLVALADRCFAAAYFRYLNLA
ncbi:MAG: hypothetical protein QOE14_365 [Humisphaera sp.]|nr:hypothetical protein [Humisphaera sp.]